MAYNSKLLSEDEREFVIRIIQEQPEWCGSPNDRHQMLRRWLRGDGWTDERVRELTGHMVLNNPASAADEVMDSLVNADVARGVNALTILLERLNWNTFANRDYIRDIIWRLTQRDRELIYLRKLRDKIEGIIAKYTPLAGKSNMKLVSRIRSIGPAATRQIFKLTVLEGDVPCEVRQFENAVDEILELRRVVILGEPGAGKSTTLLNLALRLVDNAIGDDTQPIPVLVELGNWIEVGMPLPAFVAHETAKLAELDTDRLLTEKRAAFLLDGLNEIPLSQRQFDGGDKDGQVKLLMRSHSDLIAVATCRAMDYTHDLGFNRVELLPLDPPRIHHFAVDYLEQKDGERLFWSLCPGLDAVWRKWKAAGADWHLFWTAADIPRENPDIYSILTVQDYQLWREMIGESRGLMALARNPFMLYMMATVFDEVGTLPPNRAKLFGQFVEWLLHRELPRNNDLSSYGDELTLGLARLADRMQTDGASSDSEGASTAKSLAVAEEYLDDALMKLAESASILTVGDSVRFTHQLLQEYFAAIFMRSEIEARSLSAASIWPPDCWWDRTNWEETVVLLAGFYSDDATTVIDWIAEANPEVAALCIYRNNFKINKSTLSMYQACWLPRLTDIQRDPHPHARAAVGRAAGLLNLDNRSGVALRSDGLPDIVWCEVPAGAFVFGGDEEAYGSGLAETIDLPAFRVSKYPVTYSQFQSFIDDSQGYSYSRWWTGLHEKGQDQQRGGPGNQAFTYGNHPRERVSWYDAMAFCAWLSARIGYKVTLPTEHQWEKAARGPNCLFYPYGNAFDALKSNTNESGIGQTSAVGIFPDGMSAYGVCDMSGNVWEWTLTEYESRADANISPNPVHVVRGGSWLNNLNLARAASRTANISSNRNLDFGFRLASSTVFSLEL